MKLICLKYSLALIAYYFILPILIHGNDTEIFSSISQSNLRSFTTGGACVDNESFRIDGKEWKSCYWVRKNKNDNDKRRKKECQKEDVHINCPLSCGLCCKDHTSYTFVTENGNTKNCNWISNKPFRAQKYCDTLQHGKDLHYFWHDHKIIKKQIKIHMHFRISVI